MTKIPNLDSLLNAADTNKSIIEIDNFLGKVCDYGDEMSQLTPAQQLFYINQNLEREVNNGGFSQYFTNSSGVYAHETVLSLKAIGAVKTAEILQQAIDVFPDETVPEDPGERNRVVEQIQEQAGEVWEALEQKFFAYEDNLNALNIEYVRKYKDLF